MNTALISLTENGRRLSCVIAEKLEKTERFCFYSHADEGAEKFENISALTEKLFDSFSAVVFVCACGIAVRTVAPFIKSKTSDPAVIVIDDCGKYVIPVLSGHIGGANRLAEHIAGLIGAEAVITTATDTGGHFSPDSFAVANSLIISDMTASKLIASAVLDGEKIGLESDYRFVNVPCEISCGKQCRTGIYIGTENKRPFSVTLKLIPKNIVLGIGCRRGISGQAVESAVKRVLCGAGICFERVSAVATADIKSDERGLAEFCRNYSLPVYFYSAEELSETAGSFSSSDFVKKITGVDNVCERSAVRHSGGKLTVQKTAFDGVTVAVAESPVIVDFKK